MERTFWKINDTFNSINPLLLNKLTKDKDNSNLQLKPTFPILKNEKLGRLNLQRSTFDQPTKFL